MSGQSTPVLPLSTKDLQPPPPAYTPNVNHTVNTPDSQQQLVQNYQQMSRNLEELTKKFEVATKKLNQLSQNREPKPPKPTLYVKVKLRFKDKPKESFYLTNKRMGANCRIQEVIDYAKTNYPGSCALSGKVFVNYFMASSLSPGDRVWRFQGNSADLYLSDDPYLNFWAECLLGLLSLLVSLGIVGGIIFGIVWGILRALGKR